MALNQGTYRNNNIPESNTEQVPQEISDYRDAPFVQKIISHSCPTCWCSFCIPRGPLAAFQWATWTRAALISASHVIRYWGCSFQGVGHEPPTSKHQMNFLEVSLRKHTHNKPSDVSEAHSKSRSQAIAISSFIHPVSPQIVHSSLGPYNFIILNPVASFLKEVEGLNLVAYKWNSLSFVALSLTPFSKHLLRVYVYQPLFVARNNNTNLYSRKEVIGMKESLKKYEYWLGMAVANAFSYSNWKVRDGWIFLSPAWTTCQVSDS